MRLENESALKKEVEKTIQEALDGENSRIQGAASRKQELDLKDAFCEGLPRSCIIIRTLIII